MTNTETRAIRISEDTLGALERCADGLDRNPGDPSIGLVHATRDVIRSLLASYQPTPEGDHYAIVHDAILAALKVESEESVDDAIEAAFSAWQEWRDALPPEESG